MDGTLLFVILVAVVAAISIVLSGISLGKISSIYSKCNNCGGGGGGGGGGGITVMQYEPEITPDAFLDIVADDDKFPKTAYYAKIGDSLKIAWGQVLLQYKGQYTTEQTPTSVSLPPNFFDSITSYSPSVCFVGDNANQFVSGDKFDNRSFTFYTYQAGAPTSLPMNSKVGVSWVIIGV
jgi:hypothetical protein